MNTNHVPLTDSQWQRFEIFFSKTNARGRKRQVSMCQVVEGSIISEDYRKIMKNYLSCVYRFGISTNDFKST